MAYDKQRQFHRNPIHTKVLFHQKYAVRFCFGLRCFPCDIIFLGNSKELTIFSLVSSPSMGQSLSQMTRMRTTFYRPAPSHNETQYFEEYIHFFGYTVTFIPHELHASGFCDDFKHAIIHSIMDPGLLTVYDFRDLGHCLNYRSPIVTLIAEYIIRWNLFQIQALFSGKYV